MNFNCCSKLTLRVLILLQRKELALKPVPKVLWCSQAFEELDCAFLEFRDPALSWQLLINRCLLPAAPQWFLEVWSRLHLQTSHSRCRRCLGPNRRCCISPATWVTEGCFLQWGGPMAHQPYPQFAAGPIKAHVKTHHRTRHHPRRYFRDASSESCKLSQSRRMSGWE